MIGGKYHWKTALTAFAGYQLLKPNMRMNPGFNQMAMYQGMHPGMMMGGGMGNPNTAMINPGMNRGF